MLYFFTMKGEMKMSKTIYTHASVLTPIVGKGFVERRIINSILMTFNTKFKKETFINIVWHRIKDMKKQDSKRDFMFRMSNALHRELAFRFTDYQNVYIYTYDENGEVHPKLFGIPVEITSTYEGLKLRLFDRNLFKEERNCYK